MHNLETMQVSSLQCFSAGNVALLLLLFRVTAVSSSNPGSTSCIVSGSECNTAGQYCDGSYCQKCQDGTYKAVASNAECTKCDSNMYQCGGTSSGSKYSVGIYVAAIAILLVIVGGVAYLIYRWHKTQTSPSDANTSSRAVIPTIEADGQKGIQLVQPAVKVSESSTDQSTDRDIENGVSLLLEKQSQHVPASDSPTFQQKHTSTHVPEPLPERSEEVRMAAKLEEEELLLLNVLQEEPPVNEESVPVDIEARLQEQLHAELAADASDNDEDFDPSLLPSPAENSPTTAESMRQFFDTAVTADAARAAAALEDRTRKDTNAWRKIQRSLQQMDKTLTPVFISHGPRGASAELFVSHYVVYNDALGLDGAGSIPARCSLECLQLPDFQSSDAHETSEGSVASPVNVDAVSDSDLEHAFGARAEPASEREYKAVMEMPVPTFLMSQAADGQTVDTMVIGRFIGAFHLPMMASVIMDIWRVPDGQDFAGLCWATATIDGTKFAVLERVHIIQRDEPAGAVQAVSVFARHPLRGLLHTEEIMN